MNTPVNTPAVSAATRLWLDVGDAERDGDAARLCHLGEVAAALGYWALADRAHTSADAAGDHPWGV